MFVINIVVYGYQRPFSREPHRFHSCLQHRAPQTLCFMLLSAILPLATLARRATLRSRLALVCRLSDVAVRGLDRRIRMPMDLVSSATSLEARLEMTFNFFTTE